MQGRRSERIEVNLEAQLILGGISCSGSLANISGEGALFKSAHISLKIDLKRGEKLELVFRTPSGKKVCLNCQIKWASRSPVNDTMFLVGMEIPSPPQAYTLFYEYMKEEAFQDYLKKSIGIG
ncbi:MAG: PilZ domain-containing protein [Nitrospirae bacterium]|nr:PilZ domain-containing protein [Nitrospirota bacterium]